MTRSRSPAIGGGGRQSRLDGEWLRADRDYQIASKPTHQSGAPDLDKVVKGAVCGRIRRRL